MVLLMTLPQKSHTHFCCILFIRRESISLAHIQGKRINLCLFKG